MKFTTPLLTAASMLAASVQACIRVHVVAVYNPTSPSGDGMRIQVWDNNDYYDVQSQSQKGAGGDTVWYFLLKNNYYVEIHNNGHSGRIALPNGYYADLKLRKQQCEKQCYLFGENYCKLSGLDFESALDDGFGDCGNYGHQLCNYSECHGWHEKGWSDGDDGVCRPNY